MPFDFNYTCPKIDKEINSVKSIIQDDLEDYIEQLCPLMDKETILKLRSDFAKQMYEHIESSFETVRETNQDMRAAAENQIKFLDDTILNLEEYIKELESKIE